MPEGIGRGVPAQPEATAQATESTVSSSAGQAPKTAPESAPAKKRKTAADKLAEVTAALESGETHVFDTATFTVNGETVTSYMADVDTDEAYTGDTEVVSDGYFHESEYRSAPYFDLRIDGITLLDEAF